MGEPWILIFGIAEHDRILDEHDGITDEHDIAPDEHDGTTDEHGLAPMNIMGSLMSMT